MTTELATDPFAGSPVHAGRFDGVSIGLQNPLTGAAGTMVIWASDGNLRSI